MSVGSRIMAALAKLPPALTHNVSVERDLEAKMPDGTVLLADRWYPNEPVATRTPVVLLRSPYGRRQLGPVGRLFAERGYQTLIQSCRGTFGSGGSWEPFRHEQEDGRATLQWLTERPWFAGVAGTFGPSYLGLTQWAVAEDPPCHLQAMAPTVTATSFRDAVVYPSDVFALETTVTWIHQVEHQEKSPLRVLAAMATSRRKVGAACSVLPAAKADTVAVGHQVEFFQDWVEHEAPGDPWWDAVNFGRNVGAAPPATLVGGWYDMFLPWQVADYEALRDAGRVARLTIGPWTHGSLGGMATSVRDGLEWFDEHLRGKPSPRREPVRIFVMGAGRWVDLPAWPPPADVQRWYLVGDGRLDRDSPANSSADRYRYDPADPTPVVGGALLDWSRSGPKDQRCREARSDVLTYTSDPVPQDLTVAGPLSVELHARSTLEHTDFFVRLCDVSPAGRSTNLSDGIVRLRPGSADKAPDGSFRLRIPMWPTANTFRRGHRVRLQVSSGAHPLFARNTGGPEPLTRATTLWPAEQEVLTGPAHPSVVVLPVSPI